MEVGEEAVSPTTVGSGDDLRRGRRREKANGAELGAGEEVVEVGKGSEWGGEAISQAGAQARRPGEVVPHPGGGRKAVCRSSRTEAVHGAGRSQRRTEERGGRPTRRRKGGADGGGRPARSGKGRHGGGRQRRDGGDGAKGWDSWWGGWMRRDWGLGEGLLFV